MDIIDICAYLCNGPSLEELQQKFTHPIIFDFETLLFLVIRLYNGTDATRIIQWIQGPPYNLSIESHCKIENGTPFMIAAHCGNIPMMKTLISCGANVHAVVNLEVFADIVDDRLFNTRQYNALDYACSAEHEEAIIYLLDLGLRTTNFELVPSAVSFLEHRKHLVGKCTVLLGLRKRRRTRGLDIWMMRKITQMVWESRFSEY